jgi:hypothetical protein
MSVPEKFKDLRGFEEAYKTIGGKSTLSVHNMSGGGVIAIQDRDADGELSVLILPKGVALRLAHFILAEFEAHQSLSA